MLAVEKPQRFDFFPDFDALLKSGIGFWQENAFESYFLSRSWFESVLAAGLDAGDAVAIGALRSEGGRVLALLPGRFTKQHSLFSRARRLRSLTGMYACLYRPMLALDTDVVAVARSLGLHLGFALGPGDVIELDALDSEWRGWPGFESGLRDAGLKSVRYAHFGNWFEPMEDRSFEQYMAARGGAIREIVRRRERALSRRTAQFAVISSHDRLTEGIAAYEAVYSRSWKSAEPYPQFHRHLMCNAAREAVLRLGLCFVDERPVAAQIWIVWQRRATVLKLAHDREFDRESPGTVLLAHMIRYVLEHDGATEIDFGRGDDAYKRQWATRRRQRIGLLAANPRSCIGLAVLARQAIGRCLAPIGRWTRAP